MTTPSDAAEESADDRRVADELTLDRFFDVLEGLERPVVTASEVARSLDVSQAAAASLLERLAEEGRVDSLDVESDPVVWYPHDYKETQRRERVEVFPNRREVVVSQPTQFTRAQLSQFAHLVETNREGGYRYEVREEDVWQAPYDDFDALLTTMRQALGGRHAALEEWVEGQWARARKFRLVTHADGYVVLEASSPDLLGNVAQQHLHAAVLRATISDTEAWVAEDATAEVKRTLYDAGYPVADERELEAGEPLAVDLVPELRPYQQDWVDRFLDRKAGVLVGPPGSGKTVAALGVMAAIGGETLILVPGRELAAQWSSALVEQTTLTPDQVGEYHGGEKQVRPVTVATYRTAGMDRHRRLFDEREWGLIVYDEVHHIPSPIHRVTADLQTRHRLGLSVDGDTVLPIRRNGTVRLLRIEDFASEYLRGQTGSEKVEGAETLAVDENGRVTWTDVTSVMRHRHGDEMYRIRARNGREVHVTEDHSLMVYDGNALEITSKRPLELTVDDYLLQPLSGMATMESVEDIDVLSLLDEGYVLLDENTPNSVFEPLYDRQIGTNKDRYNWKNRRNLPVGIAKNLDVDPEFIKGVYVHRREHLIPQQVAIDDLARLIGLFVADGALDESRVEFYAEDSDRVSEVAKFEELIRSVCPGIPVSKAPNGENCTAVRVSGPLVKLFESLELSNGARNKQIPPIILSNPEAYEPFIEGVILGDGHRQDRTRNRSIVTISTSSDVLAQGLSFILSALGYPGGNYRRNTGVGIRPGDHDTVVNNLIRFNPRNKDKQPRLAMTPFSEPLQAAHDSIERYSADGGPTLQCGLDGRRRLNSRETRLVSERSSEVDVSWLSESDIALLEVDTVERAGTQEYVYDISTTQENFLGNTLFCHNSATPVREDDKEAEIFTLIGPPIGTDWGALFDAGFVAEPEVEIRYVPWPDDDVANEYTSAEGHERRQLAASNPAKADEVAAILREHPTQKALVFVEYLDQGDQLAERLGVPFVSGRTPHAERGRLFEAFRTGEQTTLVVSRVGDEGLDLPSAEVAIAASGLGGSRRQGAQRAGRTMRPVGQALLYVLATRGAREEEFARRRMRHLASKGIRVREAPASAWE